MFVPESYAIGSHAFIFIENQVCTVPAAGSAAGAVTASNIPGTADPAWVSLGDIEEWENKPTREKKKTYRPSPGQLNMKDNITTKQELMYTFKSNALTLIALQLFFSTQSIAANAASFVPLSNIPPRAWLLLQQYDQNNVLHFVGVLWVRIEVTGGFKSGDGSLINPEFSADLLYNANNIVSLS